MDRNQIEDRDQELVNKFRTVVNCKQEGKKRKKARLMWLSAGVLACCAAVAFVVLRPSAPRRGAIRTTTLKADVRVPMAASHAGKEKTVAAVKHEVSRPAVKTVEPPVTVSEKPLRKTQKIAVAASAPARSLPGKHAAATTSSVRIARIVSCKGILNKNFVSPQDVFSMSTDKKPVVWMEVYSKKKKLPYTLKHVYYVNGKRYFTVPLKIRYPRMRTWSRITLRYGYQVGKWRVVVVDGKGKILATKSFTVTP